MSEPRDQHIQHQPAPNSSILSPIQNVMCGAFSGMSARLVISPIDVVKIRLQLQPHSASTKLKYRNFAHACYVIAKEERLGAFWKGNIPAQWLYVCYSAVQFWAYTATCHVLANPDLHLCNPHTQKYIAGGLAGAAATVVSYPFDLLRTRFAMQRSGSGQVYPSIVSALRTIYTTEGVRGFYVGIGPSVVQIVPYMSMTFGSYEWLSLVYRKYWKESRWFEESVLCGGVAGMIAKFVVYPLDSIRKRIQVQGPARGHYVVSAPKHTDRTWWRVGYTIVRTERVPALYRGLFAGLIKAGPSSAVTFWAFEVSRGWCLQFNKKHRQRP